MNYLYTPIYHFNAKNIKFYDKEKNQVLKD